ncbi:MULTISPECIES: hypothetical protein [Lysobacter]|uniref:hypothetical protein n=1 Tax=Lysobacter TaxID=68 RepID=UPI001F2FA497|nr:MULTISPECIES: hypothetical protein [Lysobacter]UJB19267.1 hypothetical protein L1A79_23630 [Lysobacter capsici]UJQ27008.1 hypothetical protein L2D09_16255 [Lysobacter gummosus]
MNANDTFRFRDALASLKGCRTALEALTSRAGIALHADELEAASEIAAHSIAIIEMLAETGAHAVHLADLAHDVPEILSLLNASAPTLKPSLDEMLEGIDDHLQTTPGNAEYRVGLSRARRELHLAKEALSSC